MIVSTISTLDTMDNKGSGVGRSRTAREDGRRRRTCSPDRKGEHARAMRNEFSREMAARSSQRRSAANAR
jgi:hypothetical protein